MYFCREDKARKGRLEIRGIGTRYAKPEPFPCNRLKRYLILNKCFFFPPRTPVKDNDMEDHKAHYFAAFSHIIFTFTPLCAGILCLS